DALALPRGLGGSARLRRLRDFLESIRAIAEAHARARRGAEALRRAVRRPARRARARHAPHAPRTAAREDGRALARPRARARGTHAPLCRPVAARRLPSSAAAQLLRRPAARHGL